MYMRAQIGDYYLQYKNQQVLNYDLNYNFVA
jgi:hypothetical protein